MGGDGVKTFKPRKRSQRNKIVSVLTGAATVAPSAEVALPGVIPPGSGVLVGQIFGFLAVCVNQFWPK